MLFWSTPTPCACPPPEGSCRPARIGRALLAVLPLLALWCQSALGQVVTFNLSGTWVAPSGITQVKIEAWGAGGSGATRSGNGAGGGGGGAFASTSGVAVVPGTSYTVTVGVGGAAVTASGTNGVAGGLSSFNNLTGTIVRAAGGSGGSNAGAGGAGGTTGASLGTTLYAGGTGGAGQTGGGSDKGGGGGGSSAAATANGSTGGGGSGGLGGAGGTRAGAGSGGQGGNDGGSGTAGLAGSAPGGGGGGSAATKVTQSGAGGAGRVVITYNVPSGGGTVTGFNAFETSTAAAAITGVIQTKVAGSAFSVAVVALDAGAVLASFTGNVTVELLDARDNSGALSGSCRSTWVAIAGSSQTLTFASGDSGRKNITLTQANAWQDVRVRMTHTPASGPAVVGCSSDNHAIRPAGLQVSASDATRSTAGNTRSLNNTSATGGTVHNAGRPFRLQAVAVNASGTAVSAYSGSPTMATLACSLPASCTLGALSLGNWSGGPTRISDTATYSDVGVITLTLEDATFAAVDAADSPALARTVPHSGTALSVGRFVPDAFVLSAVSLGNRAAAACSPASPSTFTYYGEAMRANFTLTAVNAAGSTTVNYRNELASLDLSNASSLNLQGLAGSTALVAGSRLSLGTASGSWSAGVASAARIDFTVTRLAAPEAPLSPSFGIAPQDADGVALQSFNLDTDSPANGNDRALVGSTQLRFGRLSLSSVFGPDRKDLAVPVKLQYWSGQSWVTNTADSCTAISKDAFKLTGALSANNTVSANVSVTSGATQVLLKCPYATCPQTTKPATALVGSVGICADLGPDPTGGAVCSATSGAALPYLQGRWPPGTGHDNDPAARATFGIYAPETSRTVHARESF